LHIFYAMKNTITLLAVVVAAALAAVCVVQSRKSATHQQQVAALQGELNATAQQVEDLQAAQKRAERQRRELAGQAEELAAQLQGRQAVEVAVPAPVPTQAAPPPAAEGATPGEEKGGLGKMLSKMMQDPDMRKFIQNQQRMMMDQMYAPLVKQMGLTAEESTQFKDMLADNAMKAADKASSIFGGLSPTNRTEVFSNLTAEQKSFDEQLKAFLGDARYAQYKDYQETVSERAMLSQFKQQAGSDYNLTEPQTEALLTFMKEEKKSVAAATGLPLGDAGQDSARFQALTSDDKVGEILQAQQTVSQRVYERARTILSPEQLETLAKFQTNQAQMIRMGITMVKKTFAPDSANAATATQPGQ
jgi:hypothetical protein